jgi:hypothetical protein
MSAILQRTRERGETTRSHERWERTAEAADTSTCNSWGVDLVMFDLYYYYNCFY